MNRDWLVLNLRAAYARLWVRLKGGYREPQWLVAEMIIPMLTLSAYVYMYKMLNAPPQFTGFVIVGGAMIAFWSNVLWNMSAQFYWEKETGTLEAYLVAPLSRMAILLGMALGGIVNTTLRAAVILVAGTLLFQVPFVVREPFSAILIFFLAIVALYALGMLFASLFLMYGREAWHTANLFQEPVHFLSGSYFPVRYLPFAAQMLALFDTFDFRLGRIETRHNSRGGNRGGLAERCCSRHFHSGSAAVGEVCAGLHGEPGEKGREADAQMAVNTILRTVKQAAWLGWKVETNWADPLVFSIYYVIRPLAGLLTVGFIFIIGSFASGGSMNPDYFAFMFVGNAFFLYVVQIMMTMTMLIHEDRSHYEVLRHIYLAPGSLAWYIIGRALNGVVNASVSLLLTLGFGVAIFQGLLGVPLPIDWLSVNFPLLALSLLLGIVCFFAMGFLLCGINIMTSKVQFMLTEYVTGILYLFGGVVFLPEALPSWGQAISSALPVTYFLRSIRYAITHQGGQAAQTDLLFLVITMVGTIAVGAGVFRLAMYKARRDGLIDKKEEY